MPSKANLSPNPPSSYFLAPESPSSIPPSTRVFNKDVAIPKRSQDHEVSSEQRTMAKRFIGHQLGGFVNPMVEVVDVDGVIQRIDMDKLLERVDFNAVLDRVDWDRALDRIDFNKVLDKIDLNRVIERSDLDAIIARSSSGVCSQTLDMVRTQIVYIDQFVQRIGRRCCRRDIYLPPKPGKEKEGKVKFPETRGELAVMAQHRYCGVVSRTGAYIIDWILVMALYALFLLFLEAVCLIFVDDSPIDELDDIVIGVMFLIFRWMYSALFLALFRATIGFAVFGLILTNTNGTKPGLLRVLGRELLELFFAVVPFLLLFVFVFSWSREDARSPADLIFCTGVVYHWDARMAQKRTITPKYEQQSTIVFEGNDMDVFHQEEDLEA